MSVLKVEENRRDKSDMVDFKFRYKITYADGQTYDRKHILSVQVTEEEHKLIIQGILRGIEIKNNAQIPDVISRMTETVEYVDRWMNVNGANRTTPLKKARNITNLEFSLPDDVYQRICRMKNPLEQLNHGEEKMVLYRSDGSSVTISSYFGEVTIQDSREKNITHTMETDYFIERLLK